MAQLLVSQQFSVIMLKFAGIIDHLHILYFAPLYLKHLYNSDGLASLDNYRKNPKILDTRNFAVITLKVEQDGINLEWCIQKMQREL